MSLNFLIFISQFWLVISVDVHSLLGKYNNYVCYYKLKASPEHRAWFQLHGKCVWHVWLNGVWKQFAVTQIQILVSPKSRWDSN